MLELRPDETVHEMLAVKTFTEGKYVMMATRKGVVKKTDLMEFANIRSNGIIAIEIEEGDALIDVRLTDGTKHVFLNTSRGMAIRFPENQIRSMGRTARGVRGITLRDGDVVVGMELIEPESTASVVTVCEHGFGKRTAATEFGVQNRGGKGHISIKSTSRNGRVIGSRIAGEEDELMLITDVGKVIRMPVKDISRIGRNTQGVRLIRLDQNEHAVALETLAEPDEDVGAQKMEVQTSAVEEEYTEEVALEENLDDEDFSDIEPLDEPQE
jgi:DNA gyrase subunit A